MLRGRIDGRYYTLPLSCPCRQLQLQTCLKFQTLRLGPEHRVNTRTPWGHPLSLRPAAAENAIPRRCEQPSSRGAVARTLDRTSARFRIVAKFLAHVEIRGVVLVTRQLIEPAYAVEQVANAVAHRFRVRPRTSRSLSLSRKLREHNSSR